MNDILQKNRGIAIKKIDEIITLSNRESNMLEDIKFRVLDGEMRDLKVSVVKYLGLSEMNFMKKRTIYPLLQNIEKPQNLYYFDDMPIDNRFELIRKDKDYYLLKLPLIAHKNKDISYNNKNLFINSNISRLIKSTFSNKEILPPKIKNSVIIFKHFLDEKDYKIYKPDADNFDTKAVIDMLEGTIIKADNMVDLITMYYGILSNEAYTQVHIMSKKKFKLWITDNL